MAIDDEYRNICCESDAKSLIQCLNEPSIASTGCSISGVINKILGLQSGFQSISFAWVPRNNNKLAHIVSRWNFLNCRLGGSPLLLYSDDFVEVANQESSLAATT